MTHLLLIDCTKEPLEYQRYLCDPHLGARKAGDRLSGVCTKPEIEALRAEGPAEPEAA